MKRIFLRLKQPLRNERGEITFFACFFVVGIVMLISFLVFLTAAVTAMPVIFLLRRLYRTGQPLAIPFLPFLACGCCTATLAQLFLR